MAEIGNESTRQVEDVNSGQRPISVEHAMMREMLDNMDHGAVLYDHDATEGEVVAFFNAQAASYLELPEGMLRAGLPRRAITAFCHQRGDHPDDFVTADHLECVESGKAAEVIARRPSGRRILGRSIPRKAKAGSLTLYIDITRSIISAQRLRESRAEYRAMAETAPIGFIKIDAAGKVLFANSVAGEMFEGNPSQADLFTRIRPTDGVSFADKIRLSQSFEAELTMPYHSRHMIVAMSPWNNIPSVPERMLALTDVTSLTVARRQIEHLARHDPLTGLGNRTLFNETWQKLKGNVDGIERAGALIALDLDHFKLVNDDYGHGVGDLLLRGVANRIQSGLEPNVTAFRLGGDEFAVVIQEPEHGESLQVAKALVSRLSQPFFIGDLTLTIGCSAGIAVTPDDGRTLDDLQRSADVALYQVKRNGRSGVARFDPAHEREMNERRCMEYDLRLAVSRGSFSLAYQPQLDLQTGRTTGMEALIRWKNARLGRMVPPSEFIPIAENCGLITLIDLWVIQTAVAQMRVFLNAGIEHPHTSINLSPISLARKEIVEQLTAALAVNGVPPQLLEIEITEGVAIIEKELVKKTLLAIQKAGIKVAIDDFGAGQTSLAYIQALPVNRVKIDRSIINGIGRDNSTHAIVASILDLCGRLGLKLTAEGIETAEQWEQLRNLGAIEGQGFYLGHPEAPEILLDRLRGEMTSGSHHPSAATA
ncbi:putative bifunctional diguanylate cyclase/phosphodiesterase [Aurantimonas marina]|uniref:putative bifunctional diguanylate cyclase/phosphodiesterase n=1 Tax=Aurantimonas marina TaxID=2780508 RepID=UPI0019D2443E|nr:EAL domain-containing protein [Aurantimonas marina]